MNVLVTGGMGFIGSHTVVELINAGHKPIIVDNFINSDKIVRDRLHELTGQELTLYEHDYQDKEFLLGLFKKEAIEGIIHFAAHKSVGESVERPLKYYENNIVGLVTLLQAVESAGIPNFVFSSSCTVYGDAEKLPVTEDTPIQPPASPYGATKQMGETIINDVTHASKTLKSMRLRYFNPVGAHPSALIGELPTGVPRFLVPFITQTVAGWREKLTVFGDDYPTPDGSCIRDYIHVVDLAKAHISALEFVSKQAAGVSEVCNIGTGKGTSALELITTFEKATGKKVPYEIGPRRPGDVISSYADASKAKRLLGWQSEKSLEEAMADAWRWQETLGDKPL